MPKTRPPYDEELPPRGGRVVGARGALAGGSPCTANETAAVTVPATVAGAKTKKIVIGRASFTSLAGMSRAITFNLNSKGARLLHKLGHLKITVTLVSRVGHNRPITTTKTFTIKAPPRKHKRY